jgi:hypothetical protein
MNMPWSQLVRLGSPRARAGNRFRHFSAPKVQAECRRSGGKNSTLGQNTLQLCELLFDPVTFVYKLFSPPIAPLWSASPTAGLLGDLGELFALQYLPLQQGAGKPGQEVSPLPQDGSDLHVGLLQ